MEAHLYEDQLAAHGLKHSKGEPEKEELEKTLPE